MKHSQSISISSTQSWIPSHISKFSSSSAWIPLQFCFLEFNLSSDDARLFSDFILLDSRFCFGFPKQWNESEFDSFFLNRLHSSANSISRVHIIQLSIYFEKIKTSAAVTPVLHLFSHVYVCSSIEIKSCKFIYQGSINDGVHGLEIPFIFSTAALRLLFKAPSKTLNNKIFVFEPALAEDVHYELNV